MLKYDAADSGTSTGVVFINIKLLPLGLELPFIRHDDDNIESWDWPIITC